MIKEYFKIEPKEIDEFNSTAFFGLQEKTFGEGLSKYVPNSVKAAIGKVQEVGRIKKDNDLMEMVKTGNKVTKPSQPSFMYIMNDIGSNSNDDLSKIFAA